jgi:hypothetical protein
MAKEGRRGKKKCSHCRHLKQRVSFKCTIRINLQCDRDSEEVPCKRCARKNRICGSSKPVTKCNVDFKDPQIVAAWEEFKKHIRVGIPRPAVAGLGGLSPVINNRQEVSVTNNFPITDLTSLFDDAAEWNLTKMHLFGLDHDINEWANSTLAVS